MNILVFNEQEDLPLDVDSVAPVVRFILEKEQRTTDEVSFTFVNEKEICRLHKLFFNDPSPTDCITLPLDQEEESPFHLLGEAFICPKIAVDYVKKDKPQHDAYAEVTLYLVHVLLHLLGYEDEEEEKRKEMHTLQGQYLQELKDNHLLITPHT